MKSQLWKKIYKKADPVAIWDGKPQVYFDGIRYASTQQPKEGI